MDAILFSANLKLVDVNAATDHLLFNEELYWEVGFKINPKRFVYPMIGYIHICGRQVEYKVTINNIIDFSKSHYVDEALSQRVKPLTWREEFKTNKNNIRNYHWRSVFIITHIEPFWYDTYKLLKYEGGAVTKAPQNYVRVLTP